MARSSAMAGYSGAIEAEAAVLIDRVEREFGVEMNRKATESRIRNALAHVRAGVPYCRRMLKHLKVRCLVTSVQYNWVNQILACAAHREGIPVVELQHGMVYGAHVAYNLPVMGLEYAPDWFLTWGAYWSEHTSNYALKGTLETGYPLLDYWRRISVRKPAGRPSVMFISQGTIGKELSRKAVELRKRFSDDGMRIIYKLHPNESRTWRELYPWLVDSGVEVVDNATRGVYDLFGEVDSVVGVYSTAVIEALAWNLPAYVFRQLPGGDTMESFFDSGVIRPVDTVEELATLLSKDSVAGKVVDGARFWLSDAAKNIARIIDDIVKDGHP